VLSDVQLGTKCMVMSCHSDWHGDQCCMVDLLRGGWVFEDDEQCCFSLGGLGEVPGFVPLNGCNASG